MIEEWRDIPGFDGRYQVSSFGFVRNERRLLTQQTVNSGYRVVYLYPRTEQSVWLVHRLVAQTFLANPDSLNEVNHIDGDRLNNCACNLEWCTHSANVRHSHRGGWVDPKRKAVIGTPVDGGEQITFPSQMAAEMALSGTGRNSAAVHHCIIGKKKSAYGYVWSRV